MKSYKFNDGREIPCMGLGTYRIKPADCEKTVPAAIEAGYRLIDTANFYKNERAVGRAVRASGLPREEITVTTKLWPAEFKYKKAKAAIDATLARLDIGYIDIMLLHQQYGDILGAWRALEEAVAEGKIRTLGISNFDEKHLDKLLSNCTIKPAMAQVECHPYFQQRELRGVLGKHGIVLESWFPLGSGNSKLLGETIFKELAEKYGKTPVQIVLKWHVQEGFVVIPGTKNPAHVRENFDIFDFTLTEDEMDAIRALDKNKSFFFVPKFIQKFAFTKIKLNYDKQP